MKFTATFAVLAVSVASFVAAVPTNSAAKVLSLTVIGHQTG
jgi:hypothetical protein